MKITYQGHSVLIIESENGNIVTIDPFFSGNPLTTISADQVKTDWIVLTHGHSDHLGDTVPIAKQNKATVIGMMELVKYVSNKGVENIHGMNIGGGFDFPFGRVTLTQALHSSGIEEAGQSIYLGEAAGIVLEIDGKVIYHAGDTAEFSDMSLIGSKFDIDIAFLPIGDNFTMGPKEAASAASRLKAKKVVPIHYNTFPQIKQNPASFTELLTTSEGIVMEVGQTIEV